MSANINPPKETGAVNKQEPLLITNSPNKESAGRGPYTGFYGGIGGGTGHLYPTAELYSHRHSPILPPASGGILNISGIKDIQETFYGSYAYNNNSYVIHGDLFLGYDFPIGKFRIGLELQGGIGGKSSEISSNGVYAEKKKNPTNDTIIFGGQGVPEVDFAYTKQTLQIPYAISVLPKLGISFLSGSMLYTKVGLRYENLEIKDHPETIDVLTQKDPKTTVDTIFKENKASLVLGGGLETSVTNRAFIRLECLFSKGFDLEKDFEEDHSTTNLRQLEHINISLKHFSITAGLGFRF
jgi:opacity protein-like surface antigen